MATAGRILIIPKGRYNEETQYDMLDMVSHGGKGWICKKTCIGITPDEGEYWAECIDVSGDFNGIDSKIDEVDAKVTEVEAKVTDEAVTRENGIAEVNDKVDVATNIAKGRNQALAYKTYQEMVTDLNAKEANELSVGQNIYIGTVGIPDVWVYDVAPDKVEYTYSSDEAIVVEVELNTSLQIGYYRIAFLEGQKVDLTNYLSQDDVLETMEEIEANTQENQLAGALAVKEVIKEVNSNLASNIPNNSTDTVVSLFNAMPRNSTRRYFCSGGLSDFPDSEKSTGYHLLEMYKADSVEGAYSRILLINNSTGTLYSGRCNGTTVVWTEYALNNNEIGTSVYIANDTNYTCPSDGYFNISIGSTNTGCGVGYVGTVPLLTLNSTKEKTDAIQSASVFVRKGMVIRCLQVTGTVKGYFYPLK